MYSKYLKISLLGFIFGTGVFYFVPTISFFWSFIFLGIFTFMIPFFHNHNFLKLSLFFLVFILVSNLRLLSNQHLTTSQSIDFYNESQPQITIEGYICNEPDLRSDKGKYTICAEQIIHKNNSQKTEGKLLITIPRYPEFRYGDNLRIVGNLKEPVVFETFSYRDYLSRYDIFSVMYYPQITDLQKQSGNKVLSKIYQWKYTLETRIGQIVPEPNSSFLAGLLIGSRRGIPENVMENFNLTGLTHIIAISGYNITIVIVFIMGLLKFLPRKIGFYLAVVGVVFFTIFVGASAAVVRAAIMGILGLIALNKGRETDTSLILLITASLMIAFNPKILWYDVGFQLSFLAILGLVYIAPFFEKWFEKVPQTLGLREALMLTLAAQITAVPIIVLNFERLSLIAPLANVLAAPFIPLAMLFGFLAILISFLSFKLSLIVGFFAYIFLEIILKTAEWLAIIPWSSLKIRNVSILVVIGYYLGLIFYVYKKRLTLTKHSRQV